MAITLNLEPYCEGCLLFESKDREVYTDGKHSGTEVTCQSAQLCSILVDYLRHNERMSLIMDVDFDRYCQSCAHYTEPYEKYNTCSFCKKVYTNYDTDQPKLYKEK